MKSEGDEMVKIKAFLLLAAIGCVLYLVGTLGVRYGWVTPGW